MAEPRDRHPLINQITSAGFPVWWKQSLIQEAYAAFFGVFAADAARLRGAGLLAFATGFSVGTDKAFSLIQVASGFQW